jgi:hypothetical protein
MGENTSNYRDILQCFPSERPLLHREHFSTETIHLQRPPSYKDRPSTYAETIPLYRDHPFAGTTLLQRPPLYRDHPSTEITPLQRPPLYRDHSSIQRPSICRDYPSTKTTPLQRPPLYKNHSSAESLQGRRNVTKSGGAKTLCHV